MEPEKKTPEEEKKADAPAAEQKERLRQVKLLWQVVYAVVCGNPRRAVPP